VIVQRVMNFLVRMKLHRPFAVKLSAMQGSIPLDAG
jgi:hypothetical protein